MKALGWWRKFFAKESAPLPPPLAAPASSVPLEIGKYELVRLLGRGGMADIFLAKVTEGPKAGQLVAIKRLNARLATDAVNAAMLQREVEVMRLMDHPLIVKVLEGDMAAGTPYMVMELVDGRDLGAVLRQCKKLGIRLPVDFAVFIAVQVLEALAYAHHLCAPDGKMLGLVHSDVSPGNVFISVTGELKLGDFGVARGVSDYVGIQAVGGKAHYLSPEALESGQVTLALDLWSTAVLLYEMLAGVRPFEGADVEKVLANVTRGEHVNVRMHRPEVSEALDDVLEVALNQDASARFLDAASFIEALKPHYDPHVGTPLAVSAVVRGLFGAATTGQPGA